MRSLIMSCALVATIGCGSGAGGTGGGGAGGAGGSAGVEEPRLAAACDDATPCPASLTCELGLGCVVDNCTTPGPGAAAGCPTNGFCYMYDGMTVGYCARVCTTDADCAAVNPALQCLQRAATEASGLNICVTPGG
jgi:hypothetical protein